MNVNVEIKGMTGSIEYRDVVQTYLQGPFLCVFDRSCTTFKHPVRDILRVVEYDEDEEEPTERTEARGKWLHELAQEK